MTESYMWGQLRLPMVREKLDPVRVETIMADGIPDVQYMDGWIELKFAPRWPVRGGVLRLDHYTQEQKTWGLRRWHAGGLSFLLLKAKHDWMLFDGWTAFNHVGKGNRTQLRRVALKTYSGLVKNVIQELSPFLRENLDAMTPAERCRWMRVRSMKTPEEVSDELTELVPGFWDAEEVIRHEMGIHKGSLDDLIWYWEQ